MHRGYIKIWRKIQDWEWYDDPLTLWFFIRILFMANWEEKKWHGITIKPGQFVSSVEHLRFTYRDHGKNKKMTTQGVRTVLKRLFATNELTSESTNSYTLFSIVNWKKYQQEETNQVTSNSTNEQQTTNKRLTTTKEYKNVKNDKNINISASDKINPLFWEFKKLYPNCLAFKRTQQAFLKLGVTPELWETMKNSILSQKESKQWRDGFIPASYKWLEEERWKDSITQSVNDKRSKLLERLRTK